MGTEEPQTGNYFVSTYPPFYYWNPEGAEAFRRSLQLPHPAGGTALGLYVHIPFCVERCQYCYYLSYDLQSEKVDRYLDGLTRELELYARTPALSGRDVSFVYFGRGTPSQLSVPRLRRLMRHLQRLFPWSDAREGTFECAPKTVTETKMGALRGAGVTRVSLGVQQLDDAVLKQNGRIHLVRDVERALESIRRVGFDVVNIDLMAGLVGETDASFHASLHRVLELAPESVTIYQLEIPHNTPLYRSIRDGTLASPPASWDVKRERLRVGFARLEQAGYSVRSGYTAVRDPVKHRFVYQDDQYRGADLLGIGASAFSHLAGINHQNIATLGKYLEHLSNDELPLWRGYALSAEELLLREFALQLKLGGVEPAAFRDKFGVDVLDRFAEPLASFADRGWLTMEDDAVELTRDGLLRVDRLIPALYLPEHRGARYS